MTSVFTGNGDPQSFTVVSKTLGPVSAPLPNIFNPPKTSTPPPTVAPKPIANVPAKPLTSATLLTTAINNAIASKRAIPNVVQPGIPNFHSVYLANNSYQMTNNGVVKKSTFIEAPMTTNALPQATVTPTQPPPSFTPLSVSFDLPEEKTTDQSTDYSTYYYIAGGLLIAFFVFGRR
jgi:hypothetical protein